MLNPVYCLDPENLNFLPHLYLFPFLSDEFVEGALSRFDEVVLGPGQELFDVPEDSDNLGLARL